MWPGGCLTIAFPGHAFRAVRMKDKKMQGSRYDPIQCIQHIEGCDVLIGFLLNRMTREMGSSSGNLNVCYEL